ncbi:MAG: integral rane sensor signal transduction histidine kinase [Bryobacterales bacterium]|nr:integral rane sensor signal transduction histidine kinase [Bryobacterales bacterium]
MRWHLRNSGLGTGAFLCAASAILALALSWTSLGRQFDNYAYDFLFRLQQPAPWQTSSVILAIDEATMGTYGGNNGIRGALESGLRHISEARPASVAVDIILGDATTEAADSRLEQAFAATPNLVLASYLLRDGTWADPIPRFSRHAAAIGHVHANFDKFDSVYRDAPLMKVGGHTRRWALPLEAFRLATRGEIVESPDDLLISNVRIPSPLHDEYLDGRTLRIRYPPVAMDGIPRISVAQLDANPALAQRFAGKVIFAGVTAQGLGDRWVTPYSNARDMPGIEMNASLYETLAQRRFLVDASWVAVGATCFGFAAAAALAFYFSSGWPANLAALAVVIGSQLLPAFAFSQSVVWAWLPGTLAALLSVTAAAGWRHFIVRQNLDRAEHERTRYQKAMQFVTHEMRTPLTAIQGSSELLGRYAQMPEDKRKQMAELINSESKRLARMIETFLSAERLSAGEMEMKHERFSLPELVDACTTRARAFADRKQIRIELGNLPPRDLIGDRELMEYAVYNLMTNAVKYSPSATVVKVFSEDERGDRVRLSVVDEGIGMDKKEVGRIFEKFYRTKRAEQSGEQGTGIGLSIVEQIVTQHGGVIEVESESGKGSRFTLILKRAK